MIPGPIPFSEWVRTECPHILHNHAGPSKDCYEWASRWDALGDDRRVCLHECCQEPIRRDSVCTACGFDHHAARLEREEREALWGRLRFRGPVREWESDGLGCVEKTSAVERILAGDGPYS